MLGVGSARVYEAGRHACERWLRITSVRPNSGNLRSSPLPPRRARMRC